MNRNTCATLVAALLLLAAGGTLQAQPFNTLNPHLGVSSDGTMIPAPELKREVSMDSFEGFAPSGPRFQRFEDTGAAIDGAEPVMDKWLDFEELLALPGIGGGPADKTIINPDSRLLVSATTSFPWRAIALVTFTGGRCTGWFIGKDTVATAGHCVHSGGASGTWKTNVRVYPGRNGSASPYGFCTAKRLHSVSGWISSKDEQYDYGAIKLNCNVGNTTGWFGIWWQAASLNGLPITVSGYPGDKPLTQWRATGSVVATQARQVFYKNDTFDGQSGAPVFQNRPAGSNFCVGQCSMAIHAYGLHGGSPHNANNHGTRIVQAVFNNFVTWRNAL